MISDPTRDKETCAIPQDFGSPPDLKVFTSNVNSRLIRANGSSFKISMKMLWGQVMKLHFLWSGSRTFCVVPGDSMGVFPGGLRPPDPLTRGHPWTPLGGGPEPRTLFERRTCRVEGPKVAIAKGYPEWTAPSTSGLNWSN